MQPGTVVEGLTVRYMPYYCLISIEALCNNSAADSKALIFKILKNTINKVAILYIRF
jgi:hypothetical protein